MKKLLLLLILSLPVAVWGQNTFSNAPVQYQQLLQIIDAIPTVPLTNAQTFIKTGAWNGVEVDPVTHSTTTVLENYISAEFMPSTNSGFVIGADMRNVLSQVDYGGLRIGYAIKPAQNVLFQPTIMGGYDLLGRTFQTGAELDASWQPVSGGPYLNAGAGAVVDVFGNGSYKAGATAKAGITLPFPSWL